MIVKGTVARWALTHTIEILKFTTAILKTNTNSINAKPVSKPLQRLGMV
jgi:hypothetical protein